jgi:hypothetical protein
MTRHRFYTVGLVILLLAIGVNTWLVLENVTEIRRQQMEIRQQRADSIRVSCEEVNARNRDTVGAYDRQIARLVPRLKPRQRAQLKQSRDFTVGLIDALAPVEDCNARVRQFTQDRPKSKRTGKAARAAAARKL